MQRFWRLLTRQRVNTYSGTILGDVLCWSLIILLLPIVLPLTLLVEIISGVWGVIREEIQREKMLDEPSKDVQEYSSRTRYSATQFVQHEHWDTPFWGYTPWPEEDDANKNSDS